MTEMNMLRALAAKALLTLRHSYTPSDPDAGQFDPLCVLEAEARRLGVPTDLPTFLDINAALEEDGECPYCMAEGCKACSAEWLGVD